jgi:hypothetical protein
MVQAYVRTEGGNEQEEPDAVTVLLRKIVVEDKDKRRVTTQWTRKKFSVKYDKRSIVFPTYATVPFGYSLERAFIDVLMA